MSVGGRGRSEVRDKNLPMPIKGSMTQVGEARSRRIVGDEDLPTLARVLA